MTADEVRHVHAQFDAAIAAYMDFDRWDLWSPEVPDGAHSFRPSSQGHLVPIESIATPLELCASPFANPAGQPIVDCAVLSGPEVWSSP